MRVGSTVACSLAIARLPMSSARLESWAEHLSVVVAGLQRQFDGEKRAVDRRFQQLERQLQGALGRLEGGGEHREGGARERWAELQGSVTGLMEEVQALARRADGIDDRLWSRASGAEELARQGTRELQQQVQSLERQSRLQGAAAEDAQRRQQSRQRRVEKFLEDFEWRLTKMEEDQRPGQEEEGSSAFEEQMQGVCAEVEALQARMAAVEALHAKPSDMAGGTSLGPADSRLETSEVSDVRGSVGLLEGRLSSLEAKTSTQLEDLRTTIATVRVKVEGQCQRQGAIAERLEMAHVPTLEALRCEVASERVRDLRAVEDRISELNQKVDRALQATDATRDGEEADSLNHRTSAVEALTGALGREVQELRSHLRAEIRTLLGHGAKFGRSGPRGTAATPGHSWPGGMATAASLEPGLREQLGAVADRLEALDELADRLGRLEARVVRLELPPVAEAAPPAQGPGAASSGADPVGADASHKGLGRRTLEPADFMEEAPAPAPLQAAEPPPPGAAGAAAPPRPGPPARPGAAAALQHQRTRHDQALPQPDRPMDAARIPSFESLRSSIDIAISPDESVDDTFVLQNKCDVFEDVIRPPEISSGRARASFDMGQCTSKTLEDDDH